MATIVGIYVLKAPREAIETASNTHALFSGLLFRHFVSFCVSRFATPLAVNAHDSPSNVIIYDTRTPLYTPGDEHLGELRLQGKLRHLPPKSREQLMDSIDSERSRVGSDEGYETSARGAALTHGHI